MLRQRAHNLTLPSDVSLTAKQNFIYRMLYADMYWTVLSLDFIEVYLSYVKVYVFSVFFCIFMYFLSRVTQVRLSFVH